jgi:hypothetical protein
MRIRAAVLWAVLVGTGILHQPAPLFADPTLTIPATMTTPPGLVIIRPTTNCPWVMWDAADPSFQIVPSDLLAAKTALVAVAMTPGTYRVVAVAGDGTGPAPKAICTVTVGTPTPPRPPPPTDPLAQALQAAYNADTGTNKATLLPNLEALYSLAGTKTVKDPTFTTVAALLAKIATARLGLMQDTDLAGVQAAINADLAKFPGTQALDAPTRAALGQELLHVASALDAVATGNHVPRR